MRSGDAASARREAVEANARMWEAYDAVQRPGVRRRDISRCMRLAVKAEKLLFRIAYFDDITARIAYGEAASIRSSLITYAPGPFRSKSLAVARASLWGLYGTEFTGGRRESMAPLLEAEPLASDFGPSGQPTTLEGPERLATAADARFVVAERLLDFASASTRKPLTPDQLDAPSRAGRPFDSIQQLEVEKCRLATCYGLDAYGEARQLATEATKAYYLLANSDTRFTSEDKTTAETRRNTILRAIPDQPRTPRSWDH